MAAWKKLLLGVSAVALGLPLVIAARAWRGARVYLTAPREQVGDPPAFARPVERVAFRASDGVMLSGWWEPSANGAAIVWVHGWGQSRTDWVEEGRWLSDAGFGVLLFDLRGHGESGAAVSTYGADERRDVEAALDFAKGRPGVTRLGAAGFSIGAAALAEVAAKRNDVGFVLLMAPYSTLRESIVSDFSGHGPLSAWPAQWGLEWGGVELDTVKPIEAIVTLKKRPLLMIAGERETDPGMTQRIFAVARPEAGTWLVPKAEHGQYRKVAPEEYQRRVMTFFAPLALTPTSP